MAVIGIRYKEGTPGEEYRGIYISYHDKNHGGKERIFFTGNFVKDWYAHNKWIADEMEGELKYEHHFSNSSSVDHFIMDGAPYISKYLKFKGKNPYLTSEYDFKHPGTEVFLPEGKGYWTWIEYKKYCYGK